MYYTYIYVFKRATRERISRNVNFLNEKRARNLLSAAYFRIKADSAATNFARDNARTRSRIPKFATKIFPASTELFKLPSVTRYSSGTHNVNSM